VEVTTMVVPQAPLNPDIPDPDQPDPGAPQHTPDELPTNDEPDQRAPTDPEPGSADD
jgi:hypothetical protein